jgi:hypothetical protein
MKFLLIVFVSYHINGGVATQQITFNSKGDCLAAKAMLIQDFNSTKRQAGHKAITASCVSSYDQTINKASYYD